MVAMAAVTLVDMGISVVGIPLAASVAGTP